MRAAENACLRARVLPLVCAGLAVLVMLAARGRDASSPGSAHDVAVDPGSERATRDLQSFGKDRDEPVEVVPGV